VALRIKFQLKFFAPGHMFQMTFALILIDNNKMNLSIYSEQINSFPGLNWPVLIGLDNKIANTFKKGF
jgi:hypothetical protein